MNYNPVNPNPGIIEVETLETRMAKLAELKAEYQRDRKEFKEKHKHLLETIKCYENVISDEVLKMGKTVVVGNIKAEYVPQVVIRLKKVNNNE